MEKTVAEDGQMGRLRRWVTATHICATTRMTTRRAQDPGTRPGFEKLPAETNCLVVCRYVERNLVPAGPVEPAKIGGTVRLALD